MTAVRTRRGRPPAPVTDLPAPDGYDYNPETRVGWLMRGWRLANMPGSNARKFADLLVARGVSADASRVSRWETGLVPAPIEVVEAYEDLLDLPPGGLLGVTTYQRRVASGMRDQQIVYGPDRVAPERLERALDVVHDGDPSGRDWFELGMSASTLRERLVLPSSVWRRLASRVVRELGRSVGNAYVSRVEGAILLTRHPGASRALVHAVEEHVTSPDNLVLTDPLALLSEIEGPEAGDLVLRLFEQPEPLLRNAAAWVCAGKIKRGHFDTAQLLRLEHATARIVLQHGPEVLPRVGELVAVLPGPARERVLGLASRRGGSPLPPAEEPTTGAVRVVALDVVNATRDRRGSEDPIYARLVERALSDDIGDHRFLAAFTLKVSVRRSEAAAACAEFVRRHVDGETVLDGQSLFRLMKVLSVIGEEAEREVLMRVIQGDDQAIVPLALACLAHLPRTAPGVPGLERLVHAESDTVARAALYCAGMTADPVLLRAADDIRLPDWRRRGARWWIKQDGAIHEPASNEARTTR